MVEILDKPKVADLIAVLLKMPQDAPVIIEDADTQWTIDKIHVGLSEGTYGKDESGCVTLWGEYPEMNGR